MGKQNKKKLAKANVFEKLVNTNYANQHELNQAVEKLITMRGESREYSDEEKIFMNKYTGAGGLAKQGASGKGLLYEYYTPDEVVKKCWALVQKYGYTIGPILEPAVGIGRFLKYAPATERLVGLEINSFSAKICSILYPNAKIETKPFETMFFNGNVQKKPKDIVAQFQLIIGNPPYGDFGGKYAGMGEEKTTGAKEYDQYFIVRSLDLLLPDGLLCFIIPSNFIKNGQKYNPIKKKIAEKAILLDAYRLPMGIFGSTEIGTDIVVFKKKAV